MGSSTGTFVLCNEISYDVNGRRIGKGSRIKNLLNCHPMQRLRLPQQ